MAEKKLYIDLDLCSRCPKCVIECSYFYHPGNNGITTLRELAAYLLICRKCKEGTCVTACPQEALEKQENLVLKRYNLRCIKCNSCALACPFGTILPEVIPYAVSFCDYCLDRVRSNPALSNKGQGVPLQAETSNGVDRRNNDLPLCVKTCPYGALKFGEIKPEEEKDEYLIGDNLVVHCHLWIREPKLMEK